MILYGSNRVGEARWDYKMDIRATPSIVPLSSRAAIITGARFHCQMLTDLIFWAPFGDQAACHRVNDIDAAARPLYTVCGKMPTSVAAIAFVFLFERAPTRTLSTIGIP